VTTRREGLLGAWIAAGLPLPDGLAKHLEYHVRRHERSLDARGKLRHLGVPESEAADAQCLDLERFENYVEWRATGKDHSQSMMAAEIGLDSRFARIMARVPE